MTIEVRQIQIKATVADRSIQQRERGDVDREYQDLKAEILEECRSLFAEFLREERER